MEIHPIKKTVKKAVEYILADNKANEEHKSISEASGVCELWEQLRDNYGKNSGTLAFHVIISPNPDLKINPDEIHNMTGEICEIAFSKKGFENVYATHTDTDIAHSHVVFNAVSDDTGLKYYDTPGTKKILREVILQVYKEHGYEEYFSKEHETKNLAYHKTYAMEKWKKKFELSKAQIRNDIDYCVNISSSFEQFISNMKSIGYDVKYLNRSNKPLKYISYKPYGENKYVRDRTLGRNYSRNAIINRTGKVNDSLEIYYKARSYRIKNDFDIHKIFKNYEYRNRIKLINEKWKPVRKINGIRYVRLSELERLMAVVLNRKRRTLSKEKSKGYSSDSVNRLVNDINELNHAYKTMRDLNLFTENDIRSRYALLKQKRKQLIDVLQKTQNEFQSSGIIEIYENYSLYQSMKENYMNGDYENDSDKIQKYKQAEKYIQELELPESELEQIKIEFESAINNFEKMQEQIEKVNSNIEELQKIAYVIPKLKSTEDNRDVVIAREQKEKDVQVEQHFYNTEEDKER